MSTTHIETPTPTPTPNIAESDSICPTCNGRIRIGAFMARHHDGVITHLICPEEAFDLPSSPQSEEPAACSAPPTHEQEPQSTADSATLPCYPEAEIALLAEEVDSWRNIVSGHFEADARFTAENLAHDHTIAINNATISRLEHSITRANGLGSLRRALTSPDTTITPAAPDLAQPEPVIDHLTKLLDEYKTAHRTASYDAYRRTQDCLRTIALQKDAIARLEHSIAHGNSSVTLRSALASEDPPTTPIDANIARPAPQPNLPIEHGATADSPPAILIPEALTTDKDDPIHSLRNDLADLELRLTIRDGIITKLEQSLSSAVTGIVNRNNIINSNLTPPIQRPSPSHWIFPFLIGCVIAFAGFAFFREVHATPRQTPLTAQPIPPYSDPRAARPFDPLLATPAQVPSWLASPTPRQALRQPHSTAPTADTNRPKTDAEIEKEMSDALRKAHGR